MNWTLLDAALWAVFFCLGAGFSWSVLALLRKYAPDWVRRSKLGADLGLAPARNPDEITLADWVRWQNKKKGGK